MSKRIIVLVTTTLLAVVAPTSGTQLSASDKPNVLLILVDDAPDQSLNRMPAIKRELIGRGTRYSNSIATFPLCCPSRATMLTGLYAHNTQVLSNRAPVGAWSKFRGNGLEKRTSAVWLQAAGYDTAYIGKYMNGYDGSKVAGYNRWFAKVQGNRFANEHGELQDIGRRRDDVVYSSQATRCLSNQMSDGKPFFLSVGFHAPHKTNRPENKYKDLYTNARVPRTPDWNEADVSDKPRYIRKRPRLTPEKQRKADAAHRNQLRGLRTVNEFVARAVKDLRDAGELDNIYILFMTDQGIHNGHHRMKWGKSTPYETDLDMKLIVRGPGIRAGAVDDSLVGNLDIAPTVAAMAGVDVPVAVDGRDFRHSNREALLAERPVPQNAWERRGNIPAWRAVRTADYKYVEYETGERELYRLTDDPYEIRNLHGRKPQVETRFAAKLNELKDCDADGCRKAEDP